MSFLEDIDPYRTLTDFINSNGGEIGTSSRGCFARWTMTSVAIGEERGKLVVSVYHFHNQGYKVRHFQHIDQAIAAFKDAVMDASAREMLETI